TESQGIYVTTLDTVTGHLSEIKLAAAEKNPNFLAISPDHQYIYAALGNGVESFKIQPDSTLKAINTQPFGSPGECHVSVDHTGHVVFLASYDGGAVGA